MDAKKLADEITEYLFMNGAGEKARRLVLELEDGRNGGGWSKSAIKDAIISIIKNATNQK